MGNATIFDLDDTLVVSGGLWDAACRDFSLRRGRPWSAADAAAVHGSSNWGQYLAEVCDGPGPEQAVAECTDAMISALRDGRLRMVDGGRELVETAAAHGPVGLASTGPGRYTRSVLAAFGLTEVFQEVVCGEDPYLTAARKLGADPAECVAVEDSGTGVRSARAAGMTVVLIPSRQLTPEMLALANHHAPNARSAAAILQSLRGVTV